MGGLTTPPLCPSNQCTNLATEQLETLAKIPGDLSYGGLRFEPDWDPLLDDARFEKIVALPRAERNGK
jgi:hypothetical protein